MVASPRDEGFLSNAWGKLLGAFPSFGKGVRFGGLHVQYEGAIVVFAPPREPDKNEAVMVQKRSRSGIIAAFGMPLLLAVVLSGCAQSPNPGDAVAIAEYQEINDPAEPTMRAIFGFNRVLDSSVLKPVSKTYRDIAPETIRLGVHNFLRNLRSPVIFINDVLQGEINRAGVTLARFLINTTVGILGINDQAAEMGLDFHDEDFGQTLAIWGIDEGPYLMLPIFGPSSPRDTIGLVVDFFLDPLNMMAFNTDRRWITISRESVSAVDFRSRHYDEIEDLEQSSLDYYATIRSLYRQRRKDEIRNGALAPLDNGPEINMNMGFPVSGINEELSERP